jgi:uncharacterized protein (DUF58 family)
MFQDRERAGTTMVLTGRAALLAASGALVVGFAVPSMAGVLAVSGVVILLCIGDAMLAGPVRPLQLWRTGDRTVRLGEAAEVTLHVRNDRRRVRGQLRDAWPLSAGASGERVRLDVPASARRSVTVTLQPTRRGGRAPTSFPGRCGCFPHSTRADISPPG